MYDLLRNKKGFSRAFLLIFSLVISSHILAQFRDRINLPDHDQKFYHLGIALIYNNSHFQVEAHPSFLASDSVLSVNPENTGGFGLAGMHTFTLNQHLEFRVVFPQLMFSYKNLTYNLKYPPSGEKNVVTKRVESILLGFPVQVKFLSDRIDNFRFYALGGVNYQYDLASNASSRKAEDLVKLLPYDFSVEVGVGFQFFFPVFILSPELKISNGLINTHSRDPNLIYSSTIDKLRSRMIVFSLIFEG
ncbi:MAG TPA: outer membrane beta-barrel protein [Puia sp.]|nr:outer membrane beta-barrel protein [Puia sp.]